MQGESGEQRRGGMKTVGQGAAPPEQQEQLPCPRCDSTSTKFCYYNNYNLSQPRHFCKSCRRYWTQGGTLRDIPVGGATRKSAKRCRTIPPQAPPPPQPPSSVSNSFTSLLTSSTPPLLALGGLGLSIPPAAFDDPSFGPFGRALWAFPEVGYFGNGSVGDAGGINMWHLDTSADQPAPPAGYVAPDCFSSWPELAISTPGNALK